MKRFLMVSLLLLLAVPVSAQTGAIVKYQAAVFFPGVDPNAPATAPVSGPFDIPLTSVVCNQVYANVPSLTTVVGNPNQTLWDDTANVGKYCISPLPSGESGTLATKTNYTQAVRAVDDLGDMSLWSNLSNPFVLVGRPNPPNNPRIVK